jgi:hypothetical protein
MTSLAATQLGEDLEHLISGGVWWPAAYSTGKTSSRGWIAL